VTEAPSPLITAGREVVTTAAGRGLQARLLGGVGIWLRGTDEARQALGRDYADLDLVAHAKESRKLRSLLESVGFEPNTLFNSMHGDRRLLYYSRSPEYHIDVFLDVFEMSHKLDLGARLESEELTLPGAELLLTKLQVAQLNRKDATDIALLLLSHDLGGSDGAGLVNVSVIARICADDWGLFTTASDNLEIVEKMLPDFDLPAPGREMIQSRIRVLASALREHPKSTRWKLRNRIGRRVKWYEVPEEVVR